MRIISGNYGGRKLKAVSGSNTRPTTDKIKEALFNIIGPYFNGGTTLDLYAGSGGLGIEAVSRGMDQAILVDKSYEAIQVIHSNIEITKEPEKFQVFRNDAKRALQTLGKNKVKFNLVFLDPPYAKQDILVEIEQLLHLDLLQKEALIVCEVDKSVLLPEIIKGFVQIKNGVYGMTKIVIYRKEAIK